ncbi:MAG: T9SS type A sorting domain-containing protein [Flavobacteriaceae bacterium]
MKKTILLLMMFIISIINAQDKIYVHTATAANSSGHITTIDHPDLNGNPNAGIVYKHVWNPNNATGVFNDNIDGLWYDGSQWTIFNEDINTMVDGAQYFIYIAADPADVITHVADVAHQGAAPSFTEIDHPLLNDNNPGPYAIMSNYWNPFSTYNSFNYGFWYDPSTNRRNIYTENGSTIPENTAFKLLVIGNGVSYHSHQSDASNISSNWTVLDQPDLNGNPNATFVFSHYWGINGAGSEVTIDKTLSAWYTGTNWAIYTEDQSPMPEGIAFDIIIADQEILGNDDVVLENKTILYPNPAINNTTITSSQEISNIKIFNILGQEVQSFSGNGTTMALDISTIQIGTYFVKVEAENGTETLKLIKQ